MVVCILLCSASSRYVVHARVLLSSLLELSCERNCFASVAYVAADGVTPVSGRNSSRLPRQPLAK
jgi:hypothetical protein